ncbi:unnamed protein product [Polarella glacialis]|uniref:Solute carrier family 40 protein n=1 Tax=Polarella glacialis TaxID=89957 RepID=A0A813DL95_POLGL|nr:unnamed protein product [Polarella glacialis]
MPYINLLSTAVSLFTVVSMGYPGSSLLNLTTQQGFGRDMSLLSLSAVVGQYFVYSQVQEFGALVFAITMNVQQVVSILVSCISHGHGIDFMEFSALICFAAGLSHFSHHGLGVLEPPERDEQLLLDSENDAEMESAAARE